MEYRISLIITFFMYWVMVATFMWGGQFLFDQPSSGLRTMGIIAIIIGVGLAVAGVVKLWKDEVKERNDNRAWVEAKKQKQQGKARRKQPGGIEQQRREALREETPTEDLRF